MKVGMLTSTDEKCGIAQYTRQLCAGFGSSVEIEIVPVHSDNDEQPWPEYINESSKQLNKCDVVHIQHDYAFWGSVLPLRNQYFKHMKKIIPPKVITAHTLDTIGKMFEKSDNDGFAKFIKSILKRIPSYQLIVEAGTFNIADRIIVHDNPSKRILLGRSISDKKIRVIPMGVPDPILEEGLGKEFREKNAIYGKKLIVIFGFIRPERGYELALDAMASLDKEIMLVIAGGIQSIEYEWYLNALYERIRSLNLTERTLITGYLDDYGVASVMQAADLVLCPHEHGTGSYSVQVALAYGKPILASDLPFFTDMEKSYGCLVTFRNGSRENLVYKIKSIFENPELARRLSVSALKYAKLHSWRKIAERTLAVYKELVPQ